VKEKINGLILGTLLSLVSWQVWREPYSETSKFMQALLPLDKIWLLTIITISSFVVVISIWTAKDEWHVLIRHYYFILVFYNWIMLVNMIVTQYDMRVAETF